MSTPKTRSYAGKAVTMYVGTIQTVFLTGKASGTFNESWWWACSPILISIAYICFAMMVLGFTTAIKDDE